MNWRGGGRREEGGSLSSLPPAELSQSAEETLLERNSARVKKQISLLITVIDNSVVVRCEVSCCYQSPLSALSRAAQSELCSPAGERTDKTGVTALLLAQSLTGGGSWHTTSLLGITTT